jgi:hypothetical protein
MKFRKYIIPLSFIWITVLIMSCEKLVEVDSPPTSLTSENIFTNDATAASVLTGIYTNLANTSVLWGQTLNSISVVSALSADELTLHGGSANANSVLVQFYQNRLTAGLANSSQQTIWRNSYAKIYIINQAIEGLNASTSLTADVKKQLTGEAKFLRAFFYFYLVNLYGDVPYSTSSNYQVNATLSRLAKSQVFDQIILDLKDGVTLLDDNYKAADAKTPTTEKLRPNKGTATALLARVYLYTGNWSDAEMQATNVIANISRYDTVSLNTVFLKNSKEAIWQLQPVNAGWNTEDARAFILPSTGPISNSTSSGYPVYLSNQLLNGFEAGDKRRSNWLGSVTAGSGSTSATYYYPFKYTSATLNAPVTEYLMVLRLAEQYLIRAEARAQQNKISEGLSDLNIIRKRAGLPNANSNDKLSLLTDILHERQVELFTEWGHRWLDLKRSSKLDVVMNTVAPAKGSTWNPNWELYPIPMYDIAQNQNLTQNPGY